MAVWDFDSYLADEPLSVQLQPSPPVIIDHWEQEGDSERVSVNLEGLHEGGNFNAQPQTSGRHSNGNQVLIDVQIHMRGKSVWPCWPSFRSPTHLSHMYLMYLMSGGGLFPPICKSCMVFLASCSFFAAPEVVLSQDVLSLHEEAKQPDNPCTTAPPHRRPKHAQSADLASSASIRWSNPSLIKMPRSRIFYRPYHHGGPALPKKCGF